jgi:AAA+ ATPase superfamily predicted ATPase
MKNPFIYGEAVLGENFADRKKELHELVRDLSDCERIFLISPRRYGKTSLIMNTLEILKSKGIYTVYIDLYKATSLHKLLEIYVREITSAVETKFERMLDFFKKTLPGLRPKIIVDPDGTTSIGIDYADSHENTFRFLDKIFDLPQKLAIEKNRNFVVVFDEFQEIREFNGEAIEKAMRASIQHQDKVAYLFSGSKRHLLYDMVANRSRAFYMMGRVINLEKIPRDEFIDFILDAFQKTGFSVEVGSIEKMLDLVEDFPYNAQYFCHKLWDTFYDTKKINLPDIEPTLDQILTENTPIYLSIWDSLSLVQRRLLEAIVHVGSKEILTDDGIKKYDLESISATQAILKDLMDKQILDKENDVYWFTDVFFKEWIRSKI